MPIGKTGQATQPSRSNLLRLCIIRAILTLVLMAVGTWLHFFSDIQLPWNLLLPLLAGMLAVNFLVILRLNIARPVGEREFFANLLLDIFFLAVLLYYTGGSTNPLVSYFLIPLIISAAVLRPGFTWFIAALTIALYTLLLFQFQPFSLFGSAGHHGGMKAHFLGMWVNFGFSALLIAWFVVRMARTLRENEQAVVRARETDLRNEQIIGVANMAAGTAHELRTPLATMAVLVEEIVDDHPETRHQAEVLQGQIDRCDSILRELVSTATGTGRKEPGKVGRLFEDVLDKWNLSRPEIKLETSITGEAAELQILYDQSLKHALINFLNNAADASPDSVTLQVMEGKDGDSVVFIIEDRGPGIPPELASQLGKSRITQKADGLGMGALLSQASIERLGGQVTLKASPQGGTRLEISIPLLDTQSHA